MTFAPGTCPWCCADVTGESARLENAYVDDGLLTRPSSREGAKRRLFGLPIPRAHTYNASDAIGSFDSSRDIVAGDARDATLKIPRRAAGDPPHVLKRECVSFDICLITVARQGHSASCVVCWLICGLTHPIPPGLPPCIPCRRLCVPYKETATLVTASDRNNPAGPRGMMTPTRAVGEECCMCMHVRRTALLRGTFDGDLTRVLRRFLPNPVTVSNGTRERLPWAV